MTQPSAAYGVHSEVGKLHKVLVCSPGLAHERLTPTNCDDLLFDDVLWVQNARRDHFDFVSKMRERGVDVVELHNVLTETVTNPEAKAWLLDREIVPNDVGLGLVDDIRAFLDAQEPRRLAELLIGGMSTRDLPADVASGYRALARESAGVTEYLLPPLPNTLYTRDTTCWIYGGVTLNPLFWPARHDETLLMKAIYEFHPDFVGSTVWWGDPEQSWGMATIEGGDVLVPGNGVVIIGMSERTSRQAITQVAAKLFGLSLVGRAAGDHLFQGLRGFGAVASRQDARGQCGLPLVRIVRLQFLPEGCGFGDHGGGLGGGGKPPGSGFFGGEET